MSTDEKTPFDFLRARELIRETHEEIGSRLTRRIEMLLPATDQGLERYWDDTSYAKRDFLAQAGDEANHVLRGMDTEYRWGGLGRGAEGLAVALSITSLAVGILGALPACTATAQKVADAWKKMRNHGARPVLSLGTLQVLAYLDLIQHENLSSNVGVLWAGDVSGASDWSYSGDDLFVVLFADAPHLHIYLLDSCGHVLHRGSGCMDPGSILNLMSGGPIEGCEKPPYLLD